MNKSQQFQPLTPAALYARVSSDRQDVDLSVAAQLRALRDYADKNGYLVVREYIDEAESGRIADRPQFRKMLDEAAKLEAPFNEILVWKFSRFTRKREHAVAFKSMLRRKGIRVVSITEHADDTPTGKLMEAIIESVDEFYSENLAEEVRRGMREAASRGFWMTTNAPYGYRRVYVQDGAKKRPRLELNPPHDALVRRIFDLTLQGKTSLDILKTLNAEGIPSPNGKQWRKTTVHKLLSNEAYTGTLVWGQKSRDKQEPVRVEDAFPAIVSQQEFQRVRKLLESRAPAVTHPRRAASPYLLSGLAKCEHCNKALTAAEAKSGRYTYYVCQSILKLGKDACHTPRLNSKSFEDIIVSNIRDHILTENNIRDLVKLLDEEMDGVAREQRQNLETVEAELEEVKRKLDRIWHFVESTDLDMADASERILQHRHRREQLEAAAEEARVVLTERRELLDSADVVAAFAADMSEFLRTSELTETKAFVRSFVKEVLVRPGGATIVYTIPTPEDSPIGGADAAEIALSGGVRSIEYGGGPDLTVGSTIFEMWLGL
ncbi:MAG: recombinase family protein [Chloroflexota bacterium]|nr:recombinase family protein [Chloroflexota bacterium]